MFDAVDPSWLCCLASLLAGPALAVGPTVLESGSYEAEVRLELPHLQDMTGMKVVRLYLAPHANGDNHGICVLSDNNPLTRCPVSKVRRTGSKLTFDIVCEGQNSAHGSARYVLAPASFRGRIAMQMGGNNMTMTEVQSVRRIGACDTAKPCAP